MVPPPSDQLTDNHSDFNHRRVNTSPLVVLVAHLHEHFLESFSYLFYVILEINKHFLESSLVYLCF